MTTLRIRAVPVGAAIHLTRRALALGPRFTIASVHDLMADWWSGLETPEVGNKLPGDLAHPFTWALKILETAP